ncbi:MAG TPA: acyl carrier protein [Terracidiphilus sp.]|jgi:acyl carrier protein
MKREQVIDRLSAVLRDTFDDDNIDYSDDLTAADVDGWDSLSNIRLMVAVENAFGTRFSNAEWEGLQKLGDLVYILTLRQANS